MQISGSLRRPSAAGRPQHFQIYPHVSSAPHSIAPGAGMDEATRPNFSYEASPALLIRGGESRTPSVCSSVILDAKEPPVKSEAAPKPPASAPPSILVKPESSRNSAEKVQPAPLGPEHPLGTGSVSQNQPGPNPPRALLHPHQISFQ